MHIEPFILTLLAVVITGQLFTYLAIRISYRKSWSKHLRVHGLLFGFFSWLGLLAWLIAELLDWIKDSLNDHTIAKW